MRHPLHKLTALLALLLLAWTPALADDAPAAQPYDAWFVLNVGGQRAGYMHVSLRQEGETIVNRSETRLAISRGDAKIEIAQSSRFVESLDHRPIESTSSMSFSTMSTETRLVFGEEKWELTSTTAGQTTTTTLDPPAEAWLTPGALSDYMEQAIARGDEQITVSTLDPSMGAAPIQITMKRLGQEDVEVFGKVVPATKWQTTMSVMPGMALEQWTDDHGQPVRQVVPMLPGMEMEMLLADEQLALAEFDAPEMLASSLITPDRAIDKPRTLRRGVYDLASPGLRRALGDVVPTDGYQTAEWVDENTLRVVVDLTNPVTHNQQGVDQAYSASTTMLNYEDQAVADLITQARAGLGDAAASPTASAVRTFVRDHIESKDLSVGFASASEVARTQQGDCTEHGCLLAAMLRGAGIPARTVTGVVYADQFAGHEGVFGFHMWAQAWLVDEQGRGRWLDLDAAAPGELDGFDATHIAFTTSAMKDGETFNDMVTLLPLMAGIEIRVVELEWAE